MSKTVETREWQAGDGLECSFASRASKHVPCGPPIAVIVTSHDNRSYRRVVCGMHLANVQPSEVVVEATKVARERIVVAHWDEYQAALAEEVERRIADVNSAAQRALAKLREAS